MPFRARERSAHSSAPKSVSRPVSRKIAKLTFYTVALFMLPVKYFVCFWLKQQHVLLTETLHEVIESVYRFLIFRVGWVGKIKDEALGIAVFFRGFCGGLWRNCYAT